MSLEWRKHELYSCYVTIYYCFWLHAVRSSVEFHRWTVICHRRNYGKVFGPVHTYPDIFEAATFSFRIRLSSTRIRRIRKQCISGNFWIRSPDWKFLIPITFPIRVDGRIRIFSDTMTSQNWRQHLPRKFKLGRRSKVNGFCAPCAYFQSFSLYAAKMSLY